MERKALGIPNIRDKKQKNMELYNCIPTIEEQSKRRKFVLNAKT